MDTLVAAEKGQKLHLVVKGTKAGYASASVASKTMVFDLKYRAPFKPAVFPNTTHPQIGTTLFSTIGDFGMLPWYLRPDSMTYQWNRDGKAISGATGSTYTIASLLGFPQPSSIKGRCCGNSAMYETCA